MGRATAPRIIEWYRADPWPQMRLVLSTGPVLLTLGGVVIAASFLTRQPRDVRTMAAVIGFGLILAGAIGTVAGMHRILREETYVALRTDGVLIESAARSTLVAWDDLARARWDAERRELVVERDGAEPIAIRGAFARIDGLALARRIDVTKRRVAMNLLR